MDDAVIKTFEDLECWKACRELRIFISTKVVSNIPRTERFRIGDQLLRAARSATANIAEGYGRFHYVDNAKFCSNARGSAWEVLDHLITGNDEGLLPAEALEEGRALVNPRSTPSPWLYALSSKSPDAQRNNTAECRPALPPIAAS